MKTLELAILSIFVFIGLMCKKDNVEPLEIRSIVGDYYVSPSGNDTDPGTIEKPWKTIKKASETAVAGEIVVVKQGNYNEFVTINQSGTDTDNRILFFSEALHGANCLGFKIKGNFVSIDGFNVEADVATNWTGIHVSGGSNVEILNCFVHECPIGGIRVNDGATNAHIADNKLEHNGQSGISIISSNCIIEGNEITRTVQYHPKGLEPGFTGADADGMRIFGDNHIIRNNVVKDIGSPDDSGNIDPHVDCIQTWDGNGTPVMTNTIIEGNFFSTRHPSGKGILIDATKGNACHNLMIRNNVFEFMDMGIGAYEGEFYDIFIYNNVFKATIGASSWGTSVYLKNVANYAYLNNITVDCHPEHRKIVDGSGTIDYNMAWNSDGSKPTLSPALQTNELISIDPQFVSYTSSYGVNDYHLQKTSPAINSGITISDVTKDFDGINRPQGTSYDRGAFEYH